MKKNRLQRIGLPPGKLAFSGVDTFKGLNKEDREKLFSIASFHYMGASEYENGRIPQSLFALASDKRKKVFSETIKGKVFLVLISPEKKLAYIKKLIDWTEDNYDLGGEYTGLRNYVTDNAEQENVIGWLDLTENVLFFKCNEESQLMAERFLQFLVVD